LGRLTTHILDTVRGRPGADIAVDLYRIDDESRRMIKQFRTNDDGRSDGPVVEGDQFTNGHYELVFHVGDYFRNTGLDLSGPPFVENAVVRFAVTDSGEHYHVPLLVTPSSYATYRGS